MRGADSAAPAATASGVDYCGQGVVRGAAWANLAKRFRRLDTWEAGNPGSVLTNVGPDSVVVKS